MYINFNLIKCTVSYFTWILRNQCMLSYEHCERQKQKKSCLSYQPILEKPYICPSCSKQRFLLRVPPGRLSAGAQPPPLHHPASRWLHLTPFLSITVQLTYKINSPSCGPSSYILPSVNCLELLCGSPHQPTSWRAS